MSARERRRRRRSSSSSSSNRSGGERDRERAKKVEGVIIACLDAVGFKELLEAFLQALLVLGAALDQGAGP
jgi:hypothetical protein